jgi:hypothetical protein
LGFGGIVSQVRDGDGWDHKLLLFGKSAASEKRIQGFYFDEGRGASGV